jgi:hypothetical protein
MQEGFDKNPHNHVPLDFRQRSSLWMVSAGKLVTDEAPYLYLAIENLMFAEYSVLQMEKTLARQAENSSDFHDAFLLKECTAHSILWLLGLYEITRVLKHAKWLRFPSLESLHKKLHVVRIPLAKHEVSNAPGYRSKSHYPTSVWIPETGKVGWQAFNPNTGTTEVYFRTELADEFLTITAT